MGGFTIWNPNLTSMGSVDVRKPTSKFRKRAETPVRQNCSQSDLTSVKAGNCCFATCLLPKRRPMLALLCRPWYTFELLIFCNNSTYPGTEPNWTWYVVISLKHHVSNSKISAWQKGEEPPSQSSLLLVSENAVTNLLPHVTRDCWSVLSIWPFLALSLFPVSLSTCSIDVALAIWLLRICGFSGWLWLFANLANLLLSRLAWLWLFAEMWFSRWLGSGSCGYVVFAMALALASPWPSQLALICVAVVL